MEKTYQSDSEKVMSIVNLWMKEAWQNGNYSIIDELHSKDFIDHSPADRGPAIRDFNNSIAQLYQAFPDFYAKIEDIIIDLEHGKVALRWSAQGTQMGEFMRVPATGKK